MAEDQTGQLANRKRFRVGQWLVDPQLDEISRVDGVIKLEPRMMRLLARLAENPGEVVSSDQLLDSVWAGVVVGPASVYQAISQLRKLLGDTDPTPTYIATVPRKGYRLIAPIEQITDLAPRSSAPRKRSPPGKRLLPWVAASLVLIVAALLTMQAFRPGPNGEPSRSGAPALVSDEAYHTLLVLPFASATPDERDGAFTASVTWLIRDRLARIHGLSVITNNSAIRAAERKMTVSEIGEKLQARHVLRGSVQREGNALRIEASLVDTISGMPSWSSSYAGPLSQFVAIRESLARDLARAVRFELVELADKGTIDFDLYATYLEGQRYLRSGQLADIDRAKALFERAISANPDFALGHLGEGQALVARTRFTYPPLPRTYDTAKPSFERATQLDPGLGEAWFGLALCNAASTSKAEEMFRKALELAPIESAGLEHYSEFLELNNRYAEATRAIENARRLDPLSAPLALNQAFIVSHRGDTAGFGKLAQEAIELDPNYFPALVLSSARSYSSGEFAQGIDLAEHALAMREPMSPFIPSLTEMYLDVGDYEAAEAIFRQLPKVPSESIYIAQYSGEFQRAAAVARACKPDLCQFWSFDALPEAVRDQAMRSGDFADALSLFESIYARPGRIRGPMENVPLGIGYAHTLLLAGRTKEGRDMAVSTLKILDEVDSGRPADGSVTKRSRAAIYAMLGDDAGALAELEASQKGNQFTRWWYTGELDPIYKHLHGDPRFQALVANARRHSAEQRALVDAKRKRGEIPTRGISRQARAQ